MYIGVCLTDCVPHVSSARGGQKTAWDALKLELQMVMSFHMGAGN